MRKQVEKRQRTFIVKRGSIVRGTRRYLAGMAMCLDVNAAQPYLELDLLLHIPIFPEKGRRAFKDSESALNATEAALKNIRTPWIRESLRYSLGLRDSELPDNREYLIGLAMRKQQEREKKRVKPLLYAR